MAIMICSICHKRITEGQRFMEHMRDKHPETCRKWYGITPRARF